MRKCSKCGGKNTTVTQKWCSKCKREYDINYYLNEFNRQKQLTRVKERNLKIRNEIREYIGKYLLKHPCVDCGEKDIIVLDFDHFKDKSFTINELLVRKRSSLKRVIEEINKCEVRCSNCHRRKTAKEQNSWRLAFAS
jgi:hypothetical protein